MTQDNFFAYNDLYYIVGQIMFPEQKKELKWTYYNKKFITFKLISDIVWQSASSNTEDLKSSYTDEVTTVIYSNRKGSWG